MKDALRKHAHGYVLFIEILRAIALAPDGVRFHELLDWFNLYRDTCAGAVMELLRHRFADIDDKNAPSQIRVTPEGAGFLVQRGLIAPCKGQFERLRSETRQMVGWMAKWERSGTPPCQL
jgi:DNA-binding IclR family transcriptional regulator